MQRKRRLITPFGLAVLVVCLGLALLTRLPNVENPVSVSTPTPTPTPMPTSTPGSNFNRWHYSGPAALAITKIDRRGGIGVWKPSPDYLYLSVGVTYGNRGTSGMVSCNPFFNFQLMTDDGVIYDPSLLPALQPALKPVSLAPQGRTTGWVTFEIPENTETLTLLWQPDLLSDPVRIVLQ